MNAAGIRSLSECDIDSATEDSNSVLSFSSYEHLDTRREEATLIDEERFVAVSLALNDRQSLVSVTPDIDSLSTTSTGSSTSVSDIEDSLCDVPSVYNNAGVWCQTRSRLRGIGKDVVRQRDGDKGIAIEHDLLADDRERDVEYHTFDGRSKEIATIRMLDLELVTADLSKQMLSMNKLMRLLSFETSQLASLMNDERRYGVRTVLSPSTEDRHGELVELPSDSGTVAGECEANVSTENPLLSSVIDELKSVSLMMSNTLQSVTASRVLTARDSTARNNNSNEETAELPTTLLDRHLVCLSTAATDYKNDGDDCDDNDKNSDTWTTEVSA